MTRTFAHSIEYALVILGVALLLGVKIRTALILTGLIYVGLSFGLMAVQESEGVAWLAIHVGLIAGALVLVRHDRFSVWSEKTEPPPPHHARLHFPLTRRDFLSTGAKLGAVLAATPYLARGAATRVDTINVALIGCGSQGHVLIDAALKIPALRFKAVCDVWP